MWIKEPCRVSDHIEFIGTPETPVYIVSGELYAILEGGLQVVVPVLDNQLRSRELEEDPRFRYLVVLHSHFDHCGAVPYLVKMFPDIEVVASIKTAEIFENPKALGFIRKVNWEIVEAHGNGDAVKSLKAQLHEIPVHRIVDQNYKLDLGDGVTLKFFMTPGHTPCSMSVYIEKEKALFTSDACCFFISPDQFYPMGVYDFDQSLESIQNFIQYKPEILGFGHFGLLIGDEALEFLLKLYDYSVEFKNQIIEEYRKCGSVDIIVTNLMNSHYKGNALMLSKPLFLESTKLMVKRIIEKALDTGII